MTGDEPVRFGTADPERAVAPRPAEAVERSSADPVVRGAAATDARVADLLDRGWCLYPPASLSLDPGRDPHVAPPAAEFATVDEERSTDEALAVTVDTLWSVAVDESCPVLVTGWTGTLGDAVVSQLVTAEDGRVALGVPIVTAGPIDLDPERPLVQVVPLPEPLLDAPSEAGIPNRRRKERMDRAEARRDARTDWYERRVHTEKASTPVADGDR